MSVSLPVDYEHRVYAGWLGKCIGVRLGAPVENWTYEEIKNNLGSVERFLPLAQGEIFKPDDDLAMPMVMIRALEDYGPQVTAEQMGQTWLNYLGDQRGTLWWGGYAVSTEHTAYLNLAHGIPAPHSGSIEMNGAMVAEQIGGQIFSDIWGLVCPNDPRKAADYAEKAASVSHARNGVYGGRFVAALTSLAFGISEPVRLIEEGLKVIPADSEYARVTRAVLGYYRQHPEDWRLAYRFVFENFGYDKYPGTVHIIPNAGVVVLALLYGEGDFSKSIQIATNCGWDTDCNAGNVGAIAGVMAGLEGIDESWRLPMNDFVVNASLIGGRNLIDLPACVDLFVRLGREIARQPALERKPRYSFSLPGSTHGFYRRANRGDVIGLRNVEMPDGGRALQAAVRKLNKKGEARVFVKTYVRPKELSANFYGASFSPKIFPGQRLRCKICVPAESPQGLMAALYVWDANHGTASQGNPTPLTPGDWVDLSYAIPEMKGATLSEAGVVLKTVEDTPWNGSVLLDSLDWDGLARYQIDFGQERAEYGACSQFTFLRGYWRLEDGAYHGSGVGENESYTGDINWMNLEVTAKVTPLLGEHHYLLTRVQGANRSYCAGLAPEGQVALYKKAGTYTQVAGASLPWKMGQPVQLKVRVCGPQIRVSVDGEELIVWEDDDQMYGHGQIGLANFCGCHTAYEELEICGLF